MSSNSSISPGDMILGLSDDVLGPIDPTPEAGLRVGIVIASEPDDPGRSDHDSGCWHRHRVLWSDSVGSVTSECECGLLPLPDRDPSSR